MSQIVWNDRIDAALSALFVFVVVSILFYGIRSCLDAFRADRWTALETTTSRDPASMAAGEVASAMR